MKFSKQIILVLIAITSVLYSHAQEDFTSKSKGTFLINGSIFIHHTSKNVNDNKATTFSTSITPKAGYFIADNIAIGAELEVRTSKEDKDNLFGSSTVISNAYSFGAFGRYYHSSNFFGEAVIGIGTQTAKEESSLLGETPKFTANTFTLRAGIGYSYTLGKHIAIEPSLNYTWNNIKPKNAPANYKETLSAFFLGIGLTAFF